MHVDIYRSLFIYMSKDYAHMYKEAYLYEKRPVFLFCHVYERVCAKRPVILF